MAKSYVITGRMALVNCESGTAVAVFQGGPVPDDVTADHLKHLLEVGLVKEADFGGGLEPTFAGNGDPVDTEGDGSKPATKKAPAKAEGSGS